MEKVLITEETQKKLENANIVINENKPEDQIIEEVNKSKIASARFDESSDKIIIKQNLCG